VANDLKRAESLGVLENNNVDNSVNPPVMVRGTMGRDETGAWRYIAVSSANSRLLISGSLTSTSAPLSADSSSISAKQGDAGLLRVSAIIDSGSISAKGTVSAFINQGTVSAYSPDAALFRVSGIGTFITTGLSANQQISAQLLGGTANIGFVSAESGDAGVFRVSAILAAGVSSVGAASFGVSAAQNDAGALHTSSFSGDANQLHTSSVQGDAGLMRVSAIGGTAGDNVIVGGNTQSISADVQRVSGVVSAGWNALLTYSQNRDDAVNLRVSAIQKDGALMRVSAVSLDATTISVSAVQQTANLLHVSAMSLDGGTHLVSAKQGDAGLLLVSAKSGTATQLVASATQGDAGLLRVSSMGGDAGNDRTSALQGSADLLRTSAISVDATNLVTSAVQKDAGLQRVSASIFPDTTGGLTMFSNYNLSSSINVKATAASIYGWYAWNTDTKTNFINFYNVSGAINVGVDAIKLQLMLPASAAANMSTPIGLVGFTVGISIASVSAAVSTTNSPGAASSVGINLFYK